MDVDEWGDWGLLDSICSGVGQSDDPQSETCHGRYVGVTLLLVVNQKAAQA